jgi:hypothetical protein
MHMPFATRLVLCAGALLAWSGSAAASSSLPEFAHVPGNDGRGLCGSAVIDGARVGMVTAGRFTLCIPHGAFRGEATVSVRVQDPRELACELRVVPAPAELAVPLMLQADIAQAIDAQGRYLRTVVRRDGGDWTLAPYTIVSMGTNTLYTRLFQLSEHYGVVEGTSGW